MKKKKILPQIGERVQFYDKNSAKTKETRIMEGTVTEVSNLFGGLVYLTNITSKDEFIIRLENIL